MPNVENQCLLHFELQCQKLLRFYHNTYILLFWRFIYKTVSGFMIYAIFFLSLGGFNFKIDYLKDKMRRGMWVRIFGVIHIVTRVTLLAQDVKMLWKISNIFILRYLSLNFSCDGTIKTVGLILRCNTFGFIILLFSFYS